MTPTPAAKWTSTYSLGAQHALLKAANRVFDLDQVVESLDEFTDGLLLGQILHELDPEFEPSHLETTQGTPKYLTHKRNIQTIYKGLFRFIRRQVPELGCQAKKFDYHAVAENPEPQGISQLLAVMVSAAAMGPDNGKYVPRIQHSLDRENQAEIMQIIRTMQQDVAAFGDNTDLDDAIDAVMEARDIDLLVEEQNAALRRQLNSTRKNLSDYITRLEYLQQSHEELRYEKEKNDRELEVLRKATQDGVNSAEAIKLLESQVHEQMEIIARNEETIRSHHRVKAQLDTEIQRLNQKSQQADELRDQVAEWKHKAEELEKKANTAERYKQKLESQQHLAKEVQNLQYEKEELQEQLRSLHLWDERNQKTQLIKDLASLGEELIRLKAQRTHDERFIQDLQEQVQQGQEMTTPGDGLSGISTTFNLEDELKNATNEDVPTNLPLEISRLKAENDLLRRTLGSTGDATLLRKELEEQRRQQGRLQQNFNDIFEKHTISRDQIRAIMKNSTSKESKAFIELQSQLTHSQEELDEARRRSGELQLKVIDTDRELMSAKAELLAAQKGGIEALDELNSTDKLISESLKVELDRLRENYNFVVVERDAQKSQLIDALLAKDRLRKEVEESKELQENATTSSTGANTSEAMKKFTEKIEKLRTRLKERKQQLEQSENERTSLQAQLKLIQGGETPATQTSAMDQIIKNLQRENTLIATACDITKIKMLGPGFPPWDDGTEYVLDLRELHRFA
ncbi:related to hook3 protein [Claviceps purpurea 20.1]|uniref:Related to hook3 protein n=1 Tax=Claviceps purpurea (strain 20.1) TaxID=1111077 RepID=M1W5W5_CLAP2|nr:related to hook3 protein [Claviceps purpurea 20.1]